MEFLGHVGNSISTFSGTTKLFSTTMHHFTFLPKAHKSSHFFTSSSTLVIFLLFFFFSSSHSNGCNVGFMCISLMSSDIEHIFMCSLVIGVSSLEKCLFKSFAYFWKGLIEASAKSWDRQTLSIRVLSTQSIWWQGTDIDSPKVTIKKGVIMRQRGPLLGSWYRKFSGPPGLGKASDNYPVPLSLWEWCSPVSASPCSSACPCVRHLPSASHPEPAWLTSQDIRPSFIFTWP